MQKDDWPAAAGGRTERFEFCRLKLKHKDEEARRGKRGNQGALGISSGQTWNYFNWTTRNDGIGGGGGGWVFWGSTQHSIGVCGINHFNTVQDSFSTKILFDECSDPAGEAAAGCTLLCGDYFCQLQSVGLIKYFVV